MEIVQNLVAPMSFAQQTTDAFSAPETGYAGVASVFLEAGADAMSIVKGFIEKGQWDDVKFVIDKRLVHTNRLDEVIRCVLASQNGPNTEWLLWLSGAGFSAGHLVAAHFAQRRDLTGLVAMSEAKSVQDGFLIATIAKITDLSRQARVDAMRQIVKEDNATWGASSAEHMLARQLEEGDLDTATLMMAAGVPWKNVLFSAASSGDRSTVEKLLKCNAAATYVSDKNELNEELEPTRIAYAQRQIDANGNTGNAVKPRKQYV